LGWVIWKDKKYLPSEMAFSVNYLGADITQVGLNFSRPAAQVLGQYYQFIRLGFQGYKAIQQNSMEIAEYLHEEIGFYIYLLVMKYKGLFAFIGGALAGAAAAILLAPDSGDNTRRKIREKAQQEYERMKQRVAQAKCDCDYPGCGCE
jgi:glutamate/tyrosine decarboxylase-like PLP-dependent enzyme